MAFWSTKEAISLKRVKIQKKLPWEAYRNSPLLFRTVTSPIPYGLPFPKIGVPTHPKFQSLLSRERVKLRNSNFACTFRLNRNIKNFEKSSHGRSQGLSQIFRAPIHTAHRAVIFAIAQLSCLPRDALNRGIAITCRPSVRLSVYPSVTLMD